MTHQKLRTTFGALFLVVIVALVAVTTASPYAGVYIDADNAGGGTSVRSAAWSDLMGVLEACAAGSACAVTVASGGQTFHWVAEGPLLSLADASAIVCEAVEPAPAAGGTHVADVVPGASAHKLAP